MGRCRFVQPESVRLMLSDGDFIDVKKELTAGEYRRVLAKQMKATPLGEKAELDREQVGRTEITEYLIGWSFVDARGNPVPVSDSAIDSLDVDTYREIKTALDAHQAQVEREKKTIPAGAITS